MATILEFRCDGEKPPVKLVRRKRRTAEIVIFPGVRYERYVAEEAEAASVPPHRA
ncbi:MAG: hypothetical protein HC869_16800 [Rhodospirillales bacterium]|nr:hypothetical protein [Rhodospirillales bacterium]